MPKNQTVPHGSPEISPSLQHAMFRHTAHFYVTRHQSSPPPLHTHKHSLSHTHTHTHTHAHSCTRARTHTLSPPQPLPHHQPIQRPIPLSHNVSWGSAKARFGPAPASCPSISPHTSTTSLLTAAKTPPLPQPQILLTPSQCNRTLFVLLEGLGSF